MWFENSAVVHYPDCADILSWTTRILWLWIISVFFFLAVVWASCHELEPVFTCSLTGTTSGRFLLYFTFIILYLHWWIFASSCFDTLICIVWYWLVIILKSLLFFCKYGMCKQHWQLWWWSGSISFDESGSNAPTSEVEIKDTNSDISVDLQAWHCGEVVT
jgi:hypothetical protein